MVIECNFDVASGGRIIDKRKRMDVAILSPCTLSFEGKLIDLKKVNNIWIPSYEFPDISYEYAQAQEQGMKTAMDELLHKLIPDFPSKADCKLGTSWAAK